MPGVDAGPAAVSARRAPLKCIVWDLDETLWRGTLLEGGADAPAPGVEAVIRALDARGILQSIASKNDHDVAWAQVEALGLAEYFLFPQIGWWSKVKSIETIAERLGIGLDAIAFIDDQPAERDEVAYFLPQVFVVDPARLPTLLEEPSLMPRFVTSESRRRRAMYRADIERKEAEEQHDGPRDAFLATLGMRMTIRRATRRRSGAGGGVDRANQSAQYDRPPLFV
ncbi:MAG: HAD-IIIC family phosphatase [Sphingomonas sp.]